MGRIRTIKPEFPQSESMGRISRDARLLFILLWTIADDSGRARGSSRMLASLLFPYDDDAGGKIDGWLAELERENCIVRYCVDSNNYLQIHKWLEHQRIDKPSASKIPQFDECSRIVDESSRTVLLGPRTKEGTKEGTKDKKRLRACAQFTKPTIDEVKAYCESRRNSVSPQKFIDHYEANGWRVGRNPMRDWHAAIRTWESNGFAAKPPPPDTGQVDYVREQKLKAAAELKRLQEERANAATATEA